MRRSKSFEPRKTRKTRKNLEREALDLCARRGAKIDQKSETKARRPEVIDRLRPMLGRDSADSLELDNDRFETNEVRREGLPKRIALLFKLQ
jgi:hypothetical protein